MDIITRMGQLHSGSARLLVYNLGGDPMQIINDWQSRIGDSVPLADWFGGAACQRWTTQKMVPTGTLSSMPSPSTWLP